MSMTLQELKTAADENAARIEACLERMRDLRAHREISLEIYRKAFSPEIRERAQEICDQTESTIADHHGLLAFFREYQVDIEAKIAETEEWSNERTAALRKAARRIGDLFREALSV